MNMGTSYLVAPMYTQNKEFRDMLGQANDYLRERNMSYIKKMIADEGGLGQGEEGSPEQTSQLSKHMSSKLSLKTGRTENL